MKNKLIAMTIVGATLALGQISIRIGPPPPPRVVRSHMAAPGPGYSWIDGYWYADNNRWRWHDGYWTRPPYEGARWIGPRHENGQFFAGYWEGSRGRFDHDHRWDRDRRWRDDREHH